MLHMYKKQQSRCIPRMKQSPPLLPLASIEHYETRAVLKKTAEAHRFLAELKGVAATRI